MMLRKIFEGIMFFGMLTAFSAVDSEYWGQALFIAFTCMFILGLYAIGDYIDEKTEQDRA